jgi:hypothetical protein
MLKWRQFAAGALAVAFLAPTGGQSRATHREQTDFSAEDEGVKHPVVIPEPVLAILCNDERVRNELKYEKITPDHLPTSWFSAAEVHLSKPSERDLIVVAQGPLMGANVDVFWVFTRGGATYALALTIPAHDLIVEKSRSNGYRDLESMGATAATVTTVSFHYDGDHYREYSEKTEDMK